MFAYVPYQASLAWSCTIWFSSYVKRVSKWILRIWSMISNIARFWYISAMLYRVLRYMIISVDGVILRAKIDDIDAINHWPMPIPILRFLTMMWDKKKQEKDNLCFVYKLCYISWWDKKRVNFWSGHLERGYIESKGFRIGGTVMKVGNVT